MDVSEYLRNPNSAAVIAAAITIGYIHLRAKLNNEPVPQSSTYIKPAILNGIMVYFIISGGIGERETISTDPF